MDITISLNTTHQAVIFEHEMRDRIETRITNLAETIRNDDGVSDWVLDFVAESWDRLNEEVALLVQLSNNYNQGNNRQKEHARFIWNWCSDHLTSAEMIIQAAEMDYDQKGRII